MATLTIKNLPDEIYTELSKTAKKHRRSINSEAIVQLERAILKPETDNAVITIERARRLRAKYPDLWVKDEDLLLAKNAGRP